jgi:hypothetical protein
VLLGETFLLLYRMVEVGDDEEELLPRSQVVPRLEETAPWTPRSRATT